MASTSLPTIILGTMTYGGQTSEADAAIQLASFADAGFTEIDTARMYEHGETEKILGRIFEGDAALAGKLSIATKVNPFKGYNETLSPESVRTQAAACLGALKTPCVDILYLHAPDLTTPIEDTLEAMNELYVAGKFKRLGLSNYPSWEVMYIHSLCEKRGYPKPEIYQGMYNALTRQVEVELLPCLDKLGMRFVAYNPLAGGMLTGKHLSADSDASGTRFDPSNAMYRGRFWRPTVFAAMVVIRDACSAAGISMADAALRWLVHHSKLSGDKRDGVIIGASSQAHLDANIAGAAGGPLPDAITTAYDEAWELCKADCPKYFRP